MNTKRLDDGIVDTLVSVAFLFFVLVIGTPDRFGCGKQLASYLGLIPFVDSSSDRQFGHITKQGNKLLRDLLGQAAERVACCEEDWQRQYGHLRKRRNKRIAKVGAQTSGAVVPAVAQRMGLPAAVAAVQMGSHF